MPQNLYEFWLAIARASHIPKIESVQTRIFRFARKFYEAGTEAHIFFKYVNDV